MTKPNFRQLNDAEKFFIVHIFMNYLKLYYDDFYKHIICMLMVGQACVLIGSTQGRNIVEIRRSIRQTCPLINNI